MIVNASGIIHLQMFSAIFKRINYIYKLLNYNSKILILKFSLLLLFIKMKCFNFVNRIKNTFFCH